VVLEVYNTITEIYCLSLLNVSHGQKLLYSRRDVASFSDHCLYGLSQLLISQQLPNSVKRIRKI